MPVISMVNATIANEIEALCTSWDFPWYYNAKANDYPGQGIEVSQFTHNVLRGEQRSTYFPTFVDWLHGFDFGGAVTVHRIKINATFPDSRFSADSHSVAHIDTDLEDFLTAIYYINDSDGDTFIFGGQSQRITPQKGKLVVFDGKIPHAGNVPSQGIRLVANFTLTKVD